MNPTGVTMSPHYGGSANWPTIMLELRNVGRSPAIFPQLHLCCDLSPAGDIDYVKISTPPEAASNPYSAPWTIGRDYPYPLDRRRELRGIVNVPVIAAGNVAFINIENRIAANVGLKVITTDRHSKLTSMIVDGTTEPLLLGSIR